MIKITLKDGSVLELESGKTAYDAACQISMGLARVACAARINGENADLRTPLDSDCTLEILTFDDDYGKWTFRHTASHIMAQAVKRLFPDVKLAIGPAVDDGFYYDFDTENHFTPDDLVKIEEEMKKIVKENIPLERYTMPYDEAVAFFKEKDEPYKIELTEKHAGEDISFYSQGEFVDLCAGAPRGRTENAAVGLDAISES